LHHKTLEPTINKVIASLFFTGLREISDIDDAVFLADGDKALNYSANDIISISDTNDTEIATVLNVLLEI